MTRTASHDERLARLAARGRVGTAGSNPSTPDAGATGPWAAPRPFDRLDGMARSTTGRTASPAASRRTTPAGTRPARHHPARRSRLISAGVSTALLFGGIGYLSTSQVFADAGASKTAGSGVSADDQGYGGQPVGSADDASAVLAPVTEAPGTLPPTAAPTTVPPTTVAATLAPTAALAVDQAAADAAAQAAADQAAADQAAADAAAATAPPTTVRRVPRTAPARPKCTGSHC